MTAILFLVVINARVFWGAGVKRFETSDHELFTNVESGGGCPCSKRRFEVQL